MANRLVLVRHWLPIVTICPVNNLPDLIYVEIAFYGDEFRELYAIRKKVRKIASFKRKFMEVIAEEIYNAFPGSVSVTLSLVFGRHVVIRSKD